MTRLILSTGNIVSGGPSIIRKPGAYRSNLELTNSLRSNFLAAQQDCAATAVAVAEEEEEKTNGDTNGYHNGSSYQGNGDGNHHDDDDDVVVNDGEKGAERERRRQRQRAAGSGRRRPPMSAWTQREGSVLYVPRINWEGSASAPPGGLQEEASQYDTTVKLFFLPTAPVGARARYAREALDLVLRELRVDQVDLLIVSFPGMSFDGDCEWEADKINAAQGDDDDEAATWKVAEGLYYQGLVRSLGIAEFGSDKLARFLRRVAVRPAVDQINIKNCCNVPPPLRDLARKQDIELLVHSDCTDVLPKGTLRELLGQGLQGAGILADADADSAAAGEVVVADYENGGVDNGLRGDLVPEWVVKYTAVVRDRGVIENKGYFAAAELVDS